jgi:hypothetical protein
MVAAALSVQRFWSGKPLTLFDKAIKIPTCRFMMIALRTLAGTALLDMPDPGLAHHPYLSGSSRNLQQRQYC